MRGALVALAALSTLACGRGAAPNTPLADGALQPDSAAATAAALDPVVEELWGRAKTGDEGELARLADREGASGLVARGEADPAARLTAARAMAFAPEPGAFGGLPFLGRLAAGADEAQADAALESAIDLAARPRRAIDPEDAAEMKVGCGALLALASDLKGSRPRRVKAIRALRMLADRGCVDPKSIPADLDAH